MFVVVVFCCGCGLLRSLRGVVVKFVLCVVCVVVECCGGCCLLLLSGVVM